MSEEEHIEYVNPHEDIAAAYNAFNMVDGIDTKLLSKETERKIKSIQKMCINIVYESVKYLNDCLTEEDEED
jgi:hypothetical protein